ncbi:MAG: EpsI family protein [Candidatus Omnitrophica bacterium]|nr:EpsI family protein [Candidatus Omnitrophota bacterium]
MSFETRRPLPILALLLAIMGAAFLLPKPRYASLDILAELDIPMAFADWKGREVAGELNLKDDRYNFVNDVCARIYQNSKGEQLLFLVLDAGNFHNPKVCYTSSGFVVKDLGNKQFEAGDTSFEAQALSMQRQSYEVLLFYWLCIDRKIKSWTGQKVSELWASLTNRKKAGLMVRLEILAKERQQEQGYALGRRFIGDLSKSISTEDREYLFGT